MVPLFMVLTKTADDVAVSAMTRGLKIHGKRTYIGESRFCMRDYICFFAYARVDRILYRREICLRVEI